MRPVVLLSTSPDTKETEDLVASLGLLVTIAIKQVRSQPDVATYVGRGKLQETRRILDPLRDPLSSDGRPLVVVNGDLRPPQLFNLEEQLDAEVWDRIRIILEIFRAKAAVKEARLQVELARLRYELPFVHEALHRQMTGEHPGFMGGGEVEARTYETQLRRRTRTITRELERVNRERRTRRSGRKKTGFQLVTIAGYTNSGKSSLLNALCDAHVVADPHVFSTLQTTTRRLRTDLLPRRPYNLLFTDTVGFIRNLPPWLIEAFASTLEEVSSADAVMLAVDASESNSAILQRIETALDVLHAIGAPHHLLLVLNKCDLLAQDARQSLLDALQPRPFFQKYPHIFVSARTGENLQNLVTFLFENLLPSLQVRIQLNLHEADQARLLHWIYDHADILDQHGQPENRTLTLRCGQETWGLLQREAARVHRRPLLLGSSGN